MGKSCGKIMWENLVGIFLWENLVGNGMWKFLQEILCENLMEKFCRKIMWENHVGKSFGNRLKGQGGGEKANCGKCGDWWKFSIWNRVMGSQPFRI